MMPFRLLYHLCHHPSRRPFCHPSPRLCYRLLLLALPGGVFFSLYLPAGWLKPLGHSVPEHFPFKYLLHTPRRLGAAGPRWDKAAALRSFMSMVICLSKALVKKRSFFLG